MSQTNTQSRGNDPKFLIIPIIILILLNLSCDLSSLPLGLGNSGIDQASMETAMAVSVEMTVEASVPSTAQQDTHGLALTQNALAVEATIAALPTNPQPAPPPPTVEVQPIIEPQVTVTQQSAPSAQENNSTPEGLVPPVDMAGFDEWKAKAKILLYEDMTGNSSVKRTIMDAVEALGLKPEDTKSNAGDFLGKLSSPPDSKGWDLVICGIEARRGAGGGDFMAPLREVLKNQKSSVILEQWNLDAYKGRAADLLSDCGVEFQQDFNAEGKMSAAGQVLYPLDATDPILLEPNADIRISNVTDYWPNYYGIGTTDYEYGDKLKKAPNSKAIFVLGLKTNEPDQYGVLVNCIDRRLTMLTVSTHSYASDRIRPLWENMIYQALKARYATQK